MLTRLYVNNFKCLVNFEFKPTATNLLVGLNGAGKSTVFEVLSIVKAFMLGEQKTLPLFPSSSLTRWQDSNVQRFEISVEGGPSDDQHNYKYTLEVEHDRDKARNRVIREVVATEQAVLFRFSGGIVELFRDDSSEGPTFPYDWTRSGLTAVVERPENRTLSWFRRFMANIHVVRLDPVRMLSRSENEVHDPSQDLHDLASWYRHLLQENPRELSRLFSALKDVLDGFDSLELIQLGEARTLKVRFNEPGGGDEKGTGYQLSFSELSDGQRALIALYTVVFMGANNISVLCLDEPDNFLALAEIQPVVFEICDLYDSDKTQTLIASHHPSLVDHPGIISKLLLRRLKGGATRLDDLHEKANDTLTLSELIERGWESD